MTPSTSARRASLIAIALFTGLTGCRRYCTTSATPKPSEPINLGVDVDLYALAEVGDLQGGRGYSHLAAGAAGTVVWWGEVYDRKENRPFVDVTDLGDADLLGVWVDQNAWWVVGEAGTVAVSDNHGSTWNTITLPGGDADLHAISGFAGRPVIVGDEVVLVRVADGTWVEPPVPTGGWGQLRGVGADEARIYAVGLGGVVWSSADPSGEWIAEAVGVDVDLFDVGHFEDPYSPRSAAVMVVVGAEGTVLIGAGGKWSQPAAGVSVDLIDYDTGSALGSNGSIYVIDVDGPLRQNETIAGALALSQQAYWYALTTVGLDGRATIPHDDC
jgi:hypothetical protein